MMLGLGRLGGSVGRASSFGSGHDLTVREFEPGVQLSALSLLSALQSLEPALHLCLPLSLPSPLKLCLSLSLSFSLSQKINIKKKFLKVLGKLGFAST